MSPRGGALLLASLAAGCMADFDFPPEGGIDGGGSDGSAPMDAVGMDATELDAPAIDTGPPDGGPPPPPELVALYTFDTSGTTVPDESGVSPPLDLALVGSGAVAWESGRLDVLEPNRLVSAVPAARIASAVRAHGAFTVEAWVRPLEAMAAREGPARIVGLSDGIVGANFILAQGDGFGMVVDSYVTRIRTTETTPDGEPGFDTSGTPFELELTHLVLVATTPGVARIYENGVAVASGLLTGSFETWDEGYFLVVANEVGADRHWLGELHRIAIWAGALDSATIRARFDAGAADP